MDGPMKVHSLLITITLWSSVGAAQPLSTEIEASSRHDEAMKAAEFAAHLERRGDHYRAIGEYERALFLSPVSMEAPRWRFAIAEAYRAGEQFDAALKAYDALGTDLPAWRGPAQLGAAKAELAAGHAEQAVARARAAIEAGLEEGRTREAHYVEGWALLKAHRDPEAAEAFAKARGADALGQGADRLAAAVPELESIPHRSPALAGVLGVVPGLGHLYLGQPGIAASALVWNGLFGWALYDALRERQWSLAAVLGLFEAMWYGGSILGAIGGAERYNRDARVNALEDLSRISPPRLPDEYGRLSQ